jgi:hypothetical protein
MEILDMVVPKRGADRRMFSRCEFAPVDGLPIILAGLRTAQIAEVRGVTFGMVETLSPETYEALTLGRIGRFSVTEKGALDDADAEARTIDRAVVIARSRHNGVREFASGIVVLASA